MWSVNEKNYKQYDKPERDLEKLPVGIYTLEYGMFGMYLERKRDKFDFPYKLYGQTGFADRVIKTYKAGNANFGVLLCGLKGTGKTVEAEQICNASGLPVIMASQQYNEGRDLIQFLDTVDQDVVVMIDEYEKIFGASNALLSVMDGTLAAKHRRLFVLTANAASISDALLDRPSRIHYLKKFGNLATPVVVEVVDDMLEHPELRDEVVNYIGTLEIITIDIIKTVVREVNLHAEAPERFKDLLNVTSRNSERWDIFNVDNEPLEKWVKISMLDPFQKGYDLISTSFESPQGHYYGIISSASKKTGKVVTDRGTYYIRKSNLLSQKVKFLETAV